MQKILIVEDDFALNEGISYAFKQAGYLTESAHNLQDAKAFYTKEKPAVVLLDVNLPDGEGFSFCTWMQGRQTTPTLFLSARDLEEDVLKGYEMGGEDYVTKPFSMKVLLKKIEVLLKREGTANFFDDGFLKIDFDTAKVQVDGSQCALTPTEYRLLKYLSSHPGKLLTYSVLLEQLWDHDSRFVDKHTLAVNVNRLRGKIENPEHQYISNVYGMGYQWLR